MERVRGLRARGREELDRLSATVNQFLDRIAVDLSRGPVNLPCFPDIVPRIRAAIADPRPSAIIARTSTTHGLSVLPAGADGHFIKLPARLAEAAIRELEARLA